MIYALLVVPKISKILRFLILVKLISSAIIAKNFGLIELRIWDLSPYLLCRNHLLGEHRELHAMWAVITEKKTGYSKHPETIRWNGKLKAMYLRHEKLVLEMKSRGYNHKSSLDKRKAIGKSIQNEFVNTISEQIEILKNKNCDCKLI